MDDSRSKSANFADNKDFPLMPFYWDISRFLKKRQFLISLLHFLERFRRARTYLNLSTKRLPFVQIECKKVIFCDWLDACIIFNRLFWYFLKLEKSNRSKIFVIYHPTTK